jgi:hypothetical protein
MPLLQARNAIYEMRYYTLSQLSDSVISGFGVTQTDIGSFKGFADFQYTA